MPPARIVFWASTIGGIAFAARSVLTQPPSLAVCIACAIAYNALLLCGVFVLRLRMFADAVVHGPRDATGVVLTFDDGPDPVHTRAVLDALDGLDGDADVTFILTTNRVQVLERALAERPGRVDLAVEIPLPDVGSRRRLFRHYASGLPFSPRAIDAAADRAVETTGSFAKELVRRAVLSAAEQDRVVTDEDLSMALDELLDAGAQLARNLLGGGATREQDGHSHGSWGAYTPLTSS